MSDTSQGGGHRMITLSEDALREIIEAPFNRMSDSLDNLASAMAGETKRKWRNIYILLGGIIIGIFCILAFLWWRAEVTEDARKQDTVQQEEIRVALRDVITTFVDQSENDPDRITRDEVVALVATVNSAICGLEQKLTGEVSICPVAAPAP